MNEEEAVDGLCSLGCNQKRSSCGKRFDDVKDMNSNLF